VRNRDILKSAFHALTLVGLVSLVALFMFGCGKREEQAPATAGTSTVAPTQPSASAPEPENTPATEPSVPAAAGSEPTTADATGRCSPTISECADRRFHAKGGGEDRPDS